MELSGVTVPCARPLRARAGMCTRLHTRAHPHMSRVRPGVNAERFIIREFSLSLFFTRVRIIDIVPVRDFRSCFFLAESPYSSFTKPSPMPKHRSLGDFKPSAMDEPCVQWRSHGQARAGPWQTRVSRDGRGTDSRFEEP